ncbi:MAG TPA: glucan ABC transporter ATP-binding protein/ permease [Pseudolabrys sp.]|nr:glucan ABC transporter ATP-binding protein/ permease [Pseudolabrys sp.]
MGFLQVYARALAKLGPDSSLGWLLALANVAVTIALFAEPVLFGSVINVLAVAQADSASADWAKLWWLVLVWASLGMFTIVCGTLIALVADRLAHRRRLAVLSSYFEHVLQLPLAYHGETHSGRLMKIMLQGTDALWAFWLGFFREHLAAFVSLLLLVPLTLLINWRMAILLIVLCVLFAALTALVLHKTETLQSKVQTYHSDLTERASDAIGNIALVHSFVRVESEVVALKSISERLLAAQYPVLSWWAVATVLTRASTTLAILSIVALGAWLFRNNLITVGEIATFVALAGLVVARLEQAVSFTNRMTLDAARLYEFFDVLGTTPAMHDRPNAIDPGRLIGRVEFDDVSFSYDRKRPAVSGLSFTALPGETVALVGATGAGKSTALMLLHRAFDPQSGCIRIDGIDVRDIQIGALRHNIGVVFQEALLFNRSFAENLRVGKPDATDEQLGDAARRAQALNFIEYKVEGFDAIVGERGRLLSGGERQRLSIARALLKDPPILILDEATSALDAATESHVLAALDEVMRNRTTFVIAHRLATIRNATRILVFDHGRIVEMGTFQELQRSGGVFTRLITEQFAGLGASEEPAMQVRPQ